MTTETPRRVQLRRTKGWRKPANTVGIARPSKWGNPYFLGRVGDMRRWTGWFVGEIDKVWADHGSYPTKEQAAARAVELYRLHTGPEGDHKLDVEAVRRDLAGRNLACWCPVDQPCHADVLLEIANQQSGGVTP